jgi:MYXO-CTERM domain-containing protein
MRNETESDRHTWQACGHFCGRILGLVLGATLLVAATSAQAALLARDLNGDTVTDAYYDTALNITWLRDWNYAKTSGHDLDGAMNWSTANAWAQSLTFGGYTDWRLPRIEDTGNPGCDYSTHGGSDCGYNVDTATSEIAHLFHITLGNLSAYDTDGNARGGISMVDFGAVNTAPFVNMKPSAYWLGPEYLSSDSPSAWMFAVDIGLQAGFPKTWEFYAVAVRPGDVAASVPEPQALALALLALGAAGVARRQRPR